MCVINNNSSNKSWFRADWLSAAHSPWTHVAENVLYLRPLSSALSVQRRTRSVCVMSCEWAVVLNKRAWTGFFSLFICTRRLLFFSCPSSLFLPLLSSLVHSFHSQFLPSLFRSALLSGFSYWYSEDERWWKWGYAEKLSPWPCVEGTKGIITVYFIPRLSCGISIKSPFQESE